MGLLLATRRALVASTAWTPDELLPDAGLLPEHWYRSDGPLWQDAGITAAAADGDVVGRWEDKSANADHVNQAVAGDKPTYQSGAGDLLHGHPVIRFDGASDYLQGAYTTGGEITQPNTIFAVAKMDAGAVDDGTYRALLYSDDVVNKQYLYQNVQAGADTWAIFAGVALDGNASDSNWNIWTCLFNGASSRFWHNGVAECAAGNAGAQTMDGLTIGANPAGGAPWDGDIAEILIYDGNLSDADKDQVGQYLAARYNLGYTDIA